MSSGGYRGYRGVSEEADTRERCAPAASVGPESGRRAEQGQPLCSAQESADRRTVVQSQADSDRPLESPCSASASAGTAVAPRPRAAPPRVSVRTGGEQDVGTGHQAAHARAVRCLLGSHSSPRVTVCNRGNVTRSCNGKSTWGKDSLHRPWGESRLGSTPASPHPRRTHSVPRRGPDGSWRREPMGLRGVLQEGTIGTAGVSDHLSSFFVTT